MTVTGPRSPDAVRSADLTAGQVWRALRAPLAVLLLVLLVGAGIGYVNSRQKHGLLDPRVYHPAGSHAVAQLLTERGVSVELVRTTQEAVARADSGSTLLVLLPELLQQSQLDALKEATTRRIVLVGPSEQSLATFAPGLTRTDDAVEVEAREPACDLPAAERAGDADTGGVLVEARPGTGGRVALCYATGGRAGLASLDTPNPDRNVVVMGAPTPLRNDKLDHHGNAALALNLLGQQPRLVWYLPSLGDALATEEESPYELMADGWKWAFLQVAIATVLLALWRMRRLGPVVAEPLPVVVRAAETVEGRARLYRRAKARDRAAEVLRSATRERLAPLVGQAPASSHALVDAVATRIGWPADDVGRLLYGSVPVDDAVLVRLADDLDALESEVLSS